MSFWKSSLGTIDGSEKNAFAVQMKIIPNETYALARLKAYEMAIFEESKHYQATWQLIDGEFKGAQVRQKLPVFDDNDNKAFRSLNMMMRLNLLSDFTPEHDEEPTQADLNKVVGLIAGLVIMQWHMDDKSGNWISEVHPAKGFECKTGTLITAPALAPVIDAYAPLLGVSSVVDRGWHPPPITHATQQPIHIQNGLETSLQRQLRERDAVQLKESLEKNKEFNDDLPF